MNLAETLLGGGTRDPDAVALHGPGGPTTSGDLAERAARWAGALDAAGVAPGDRVALRLPNGVDFAAAYLGILGAGAVAVPVNPMAPAAELDRELEVVDARLVVAERAVQRSPRPVLTPDGLSDAPVLGSPRPRAGGDAAALLFTSGTGGPPKAAVLTHASLAANLEQVQRHPGLALGPDDVVLGALPFFHVFGLNVVLGLALAAGASVVTVAEIGVDTPALIARHRVSVVAGVPAMYRAWLSAPGIPPDAFASVRLAVSGAAPLPDAVAEGMRERFGVVLHQGYGLTEASPIVTTTALTAHPRPGSIGPPLPGVEVRLVDGDGRDVLAGDPGEVWVRGPNVFAGYWEDDAATARVLTPDGWLRTGDVAVADDDGELSLVDRAKDLVIVSGFNVFPAEVEEVLRDDPGVADVAVVGEPDERTGEAVVAHVVPAPGATPDPEALRELARERLARYKCPARVEIVAELPRSPVGKLLRRELRDAPAEGS